MSSDGGALLLQAVDQRISLTRRLAACFVDHRNPRRCEHSLQRLLAQRLFGLALGYEDLCDHDRLRDDSLLALALGSDDLSGERRLPRPGTWRTGSRSSSWICSRTGLRRRRGGRTSCGCTGPCSRRRCWRCCDNAGWRGRSWRGCGRRRRDSLWASGRDSRGATRGGQREVCSPCANSPSRTGRVPRNRSRLTQIWLREGIPERQGREISCRPASNSPLPGPVTPKSEAA